MGGAQFVSSSSNAFNSCIDDCNLIDLGFSGSMFTWSKGDLRERLDRAMSNEAWLNLFPSSSVTNRPIPSSDHSGIWWKLEPKESPRSNYFKFLGSCLIIRTLLIKLEALGSIPKPGVRTLKVLLLLLRFGISLSLETYLEGKKEFLEGLKELIDLCCITRMTDS